MRLFSSQASLGKQVNEEAAGACSSASDVAALSLRGPRKQHDLSASHFPLGMRVEITDCMTERQKKVCLRFGSLNKQAQILDMVLTLLTA